jgi:lipopolysaccharide export system ATP-binding protein
MIALLRTDNVTKSYRGRRVVDCVSIEVREGEIVGLLGPNGAGKTTTFYMIVGMITPDGGRVYLDDQELTRLPMYQRARKERLERLLSELKIVHLKRRVAASLSGGERRRLEIARALVTEPHFLLLDEPFTGIDPIVRGDIQGIVKELGKKGLGVLITDHNVRETLEITDKAYIIYEGKILLSGTATELIEDKKARELYLGPDFRM